LWIFVVVNFWLALLIAGCSAAPGPILNTGDQTRLFAVFDKIRRGQTITVIGLGGSITANAMAGSAEKGWLALSSQWFYDTYGSAGGSVNVVNSGVGQTNSTYGALRFDCDVRAHNPDLLIVDYAVNDGPSDLVHYESVIRKALNTPGLAVIVNMFSNGRGQSQQEAQADIVSNYDLPAVSYRDGVADLVAQGATSWALVTAPDKVHPNELGHSYASRFMRQLYDLVKKNYDTARRLPAPAHPGSLERVEYLSGAAFDDAVINRSNLPDGNFHYFAAAKSHTSNTAGAFAEIQADVGPLGEVWLNVLDAPGWGTIATFVDGVAHNVHDCNNPANTNGAINSYRVASGLTSGLHTIKIQNWPSPSGSINNNIWVQGIGFSAR
jgi:hypothetical protein